MNPTLREWLWPILYPLAWIWAAVAYLRRTIPRKPFEPSRPTLVIGNLHSGGSGKTPIVAAIAEKLRGSRPVILSRGYRGKFSRIGACVQTSSALGPQRYGDEAWMLAQRLGVPVWVGRDRVTLLQQAEKKSDPGFFLFDDAYQNLTFRHDVSLVAIKTDRSLYESDCLPLGQLREPLSGLRKATAVVLIPGQFEDRKREWELYLQGTFPAIPVFEATIEVEGLWAKEGKVPFSTSLQWGAFCGVADPGGFKKSLSSILTPVFLHEYGDHWDYRSSDISFLLKLKERFGANHLVTTEKDWHKAWPLLEVHSLPLYYLRMRYVFSSEFWYFLKSQLGIA